MKTTFARTKINLPSHPSNIIIEIISIDERLIYEDYRNGDIIPIGYETTIHFIKNGIRNLSILSGRVTDVLEFLPDTPTTRILFESNNT